jgi:hypothetical protein
MNKYVKIFIKLQAAIKNILFRLPELLNSTLNVLQILTALIFLILLVIKGEE